MKPLALNPFFLKTSSQTTPCSTVRVASAMKATMSEAGMSLFAPTDMRCHICLRMEAL